MSTLKVTVEKLIVEPHPNADLLELAQVGLYRAVVPKDVYRTGDYAIYIPEQAIIPDALIEELGLTGKLAGKEKNRVKAVRLRGELSQGIVCRPRALGTWGKSDDQLMAATGLDFAEQLGIEKWVPEIPAHMSGKVIPAPDLIRWVDIENLKRYPDIFTPGEPVVATEKIHGTCCLVTYHVPSDTLMVSSKGFGERSLALELSATNLYWRAADQFQLYEKLGSYAENEGVTTVALFGEVYGAGIQDLDYGKVAGRNDTLGFVAFDMAVVVPGTGKHWLSTLEFAATMRAYEIPHAPVLYDGPFVLGALELITSGLTVLGDGAHMREGIVIRPLMEQNSPILGGRKIAKLVSDEYLLRKGGTEFE
jgi:RNA ligase (TIGR02306 family)